jgi:hypothetical protein
MTGFSSKRAMARDKLNPEPKNDKSTTPGPQALSNR